MSDRSACMNPQHRSQYYSRADLRIRGRLHIRRQCHGDRARTPCRKAPQYIPGPGTTRPNPLSLGWIFLAHRRQQQLQRAGSGRDASHQQRPGIPRQLYLVKKSGYQFRADRSAGQQSGANGARSERSPPGLGPVRIECRQPGQRFGQLRTALRPQPALAE